ncbi:glucose PTS transporter transcription antiterminator GlcT [Oceanobacillus bengalensis]|uniref:PRD domain-containing protein n=1 Tax=Oceanobacillus bengalensis TaxID=1435466 RepID=A0A494Z7L1_9BACI|nr:PRD domain-containing protein [Oceanobacillus bengalensis]RKQ18591.1 PRD domain-containing protein [Oceanobacillus bengalensis]
MFYVRKALNNNVLIAEDDKEAEVILIGKGIGFNRKKGESIPNDMVEKLFVLRSENERQSYIKLLPQLDDDLLQTIIDSIAIIRNNSKSILNEKVHVALTDHILFAVTRLMKGLEIKNPFLVETKALYTAEYEIAEEVVDFINHSLDIHLPKGEVGFIALHIHSAISDRTISDINKYSGLITKLIKVIENQLQIEIKKESVNYIRLIRHLRYTIERVLNDEYVEEPIKIKNLLKEEYPTCYNLSWKLIKIMQQTLKKDVYDAEAVYLTMHLQRLNNKFES